MPNRSHLIVTAALAVLAVTIAACSAGTAPSPAGSVAGSASPREIAITLNDSLQMDPSMITLKAGERVHFVVTNAGTIDHEFFLGDAAAQMEHGEEMMGMTSMVHDEPSGIGVMPGETKTLDFTFTAPGSYFAGCHVSGHYEVGMKADITVEP